MKTAANTKNVAISAHRFTPNPLLSRPFFIEKGGKLQVNL